MSSRAERTLLIVDDDVDVRDSLVELLDAEGYSVLTAANGSDALAMLRDAVSLPSVILLDLMMPVMNGYEFRMTQMRDERLAAIPVFLLSAGERVDERMRDVAEVLPKPLDIDALLAALARECGAPRASP